MSATLPPTRRDEVAALREVLAAVECRRGIALPFGLAPLDSRLSDHGIDSAGLHEIAPASAELSDDAAATLFVAGVSARFAAKKNANVLWILTRFDLYAPGLEQAGLAPAQLIYAEAKDDTQVLALAEDGLRDGALAAVIGEVRRADMTATRRLQLPLADDGSELLKARLHRFANPRSSTAKLSCGEHEVTRLPGEAGIARSRAKFPTTNANALALVAVQVEGEDLSRMSPPASLAARWSSKTDTRRLARSPKPRMLSAALRKREFKFVAPGVA